MSYGQRGLGQAPASSGSLTDWVNAFLATPEGQAARADVAGALAPFTASAGEAGAAYWLKAHAVPLALGGAALVFVLTRGRR